MQRGAEFSGGELSRGSEWEVRRDDRTDVVLIVWKPKRRSTSRCSAACIQPVVVRPARAMGRWSASGIPFMFFLSARALNGSQGRGFQRRVHG